MHVNGRDVEFDRLSEAATRWSSAPLEVRRALLVEVRHGVALVAPEWVEVACRVKGLAGDSPLAGEEWMTGPYAVLLYLAALLRSIDRLAAGGSPLDDVHVHRVTADRLAVRIVPFEAYDRVLFSGHRGEVWLRPGVTTAQVRATSGRALRDGSGPGGVTLVLGAGNITSIAPLDVLHQLYVENSAVVLKLNPVLGDLAPVLAEAFAPLIRDGYLALVSGGADVGAALTSHPVVSRIHITGSNASHDVIVFGTGPEGAARKAANTPRLDKPITSELGGVGPTIVVPGDWRAADLAYHARHVATQRLHNGGFNCIATQVVVLSAEWSRTPAFVAALRAALRAAPPRPAWYPGAADRVQRFRAEYPAAEVLDGGEPPRLLATGVSPDEDQPAFRTEYFAPVCATTELPGTSPADFLDAAVDFCNERLFGTLGANILIHPRTAAALHGRLAAAIARLRYGNIAVNSWVGFNYVTPRASWGGYPGHDLREPGSGIGVVHNALLLEQPERTVLRGPFRPAPRSLLSPEPSLSPTPPWFVDHRRGHVAARRLTGFAAEPSWRRLLGALPPAMRG